jgi:hypothetical protein
MRILLVFSLAAGALQAQDRPAPALSAGPHGAWSVVPALPGMGRAIDTEATAARRQELLARIGRGVVLIPAAHARDLETEYVQDNDFRQHNTFFYFTGLEVQDAWLLMAVRAPDSTDVVLFLPPRNPAQERWTGVRLGPDSASPRRTGIATVLPLDSLDRRLRLAQLRTRGPVYIPLDATTKHESRLAELTFAGRDVRNLRPIVDSMRLVKDADELARLRMAVDISVLGHLAAMRRRVRACSSDEIEAFPSKVKCAVRAPTGWVSVDRRRWSTGTTPITTPTGAAPRTANCRHRRRSVRQYTADITRTRAANGSSRPGSGRATISCWPRSRRPSTRCDRA